jgi:hypothetical protein
MQGLGIFVQASILTLLLVAIRKRTTYNNDRLDDVVGDYANVIADGIH